MGEPADPKVKFAILRLQGKPVREAVVQMVIDKKQTADAVGRRMVRQIRRRKPK